jgi:hypothetical protein
MVNDHDACVFNKTENGVQCTLAFHVDNLLVTCSYQEMINALIKHLEANFQHISVYTGDVHSYLGMNIVVCPSSQSIVIDMINYTKEVLKPTEGKQYKLNAAKTAYFHSMVAKLLYIWQSARDRRFLPQSAG